MITNHNINWYIIYIYIEGRRWVYRAEGTVSSSSQWPGRCRGSYICMELFNMGVVAGGSGGICETLNRNQQHVWQMQGFSRTEVSAVMCMADTTVFRSLLRCLMQGDKGGLHSQFISSKKKNCWAFSHQQWKPVVFPSSILTCLLHLWTWK